MGLANDLSSFAATVVRLGRGISRRGAANTAPARPLELYDFEACPYCRRVREVLTELDLDYVAHPVAHGSTRRQELRRLGGKVQVPYLVDPNTDRRLYESADIIRYLRSTYGTQRTPWSLPLPNIVDTLNSSVASLCRLGRGSRCTTAAPRTDLQPLLLYNMEGSPYCRKVREALSELDLVHRVRNLPKGSAKRAELIARGGKMQVPYLVDPNRGDELYESDDIVAYLQAHYGSAAAERARRPR